MTTVGMSFPWDLLMAAPPTRRRELLTRVADAGIDGITVGDHISFQGGDGFDGMVTATAVLATQDRLPVLIGVYLLGLRHPMVAARQLATLSEMAPGRLILGVGVGGEDRMEIVNAGVDPATRGRRTDESLHLVRQLLTGEPVTHNGEFFTLAEARIAQVPQPQIPIVIGGKGDAAVRRTAAYGDGWVGIFCSARRFCDTREQIIDATAALGRPEPTWFGVSVWCGLDANAKAAEERLGGVVESFYRVPYDKFRHIAPAGTAPQVAEWLASFIDGGANHITIVPVSESIEAAIDETAEVARLLKIHSAAERGVQ